MEIFQFFDFSQGIFRWNFYFSGFPRKSVGLMSLEPSRKRVCTEDRQVPQVERNVETKEAESKTQTLHWRVDTTGNIFYATSPNFQLPKERKGLRVAAFDLDHTLIVPRSGGVRPKNADVRSYLMKTQGIYVSHP